VIGVNTAIAARAHGIGFAIPVDTIRSVTSELRAKGKVERPWLGVVITELAPERAKQMFQKTDPGVLVREVATDGPAAKAGLLEGDVILEVDGKAVSQPGEVIRAIATRHVGDTVHLLVSRDGQHKEIPLVLAPMPENLQTAPEPPPMPADPDGE